jgi:uncharacterized membrane protein
MNHEVKLQILWAVCFIVSGVMFGLAYLLLNISGVYAGIMAALAYIILYLGLSVAFLLVFSHIKRISYHLTRTLEFRKNEIVEIKKELQNKYLKKKITEDAYKSLLEKYESELTEIEVKLKELKRESKG